MHRTRPPLCDRRHSPPLRTGRALPSATTAMTSHRPRNSGGPRSLCHPCRWPPSADHQSDTLAFGRAPLTASTTGRTFAAIAVGGFAGNVDARVAAEVGRGFRNAPAVGGALAIVIAVSGGCAAATGGLVVSACCAMIAAAVGRASATVAAVGGVAVAVTCGFTEAVDFAPVAGWASAAGVGGLAVAAGGICADGGRLADVVVAAGRLAELVTTGWSQGAVAAG